MRSNYALSLFDGPLICVSCNSQDFIVIFRSRLLQKLLSLLQTLHNLETRKGLNTHPEHKKIPKLTSWSDLPLASNAFSSARTASSHISFATKASPRPTSPSTSSE